MTTTDETGSDKTDGKPLSSTRRVKSGTAAAAGESATAENAARSQETTGETAAVKAAATVSAAAATTKKPFQPFQDNYQSAGRVWPD